MARKFQAPNGEIPDSLVEMLCREVAGLQELEHLSDLPPADSAPIFDLVVSVIGAGGDDPLRRAALYTVRLKTKVVLEWMTPNGWDVDYNAAGGFLFAKFRDDPQTQFITFGPGPLQDYLAAAPACATCDHPMFEFTPDVWTCWACRGTVWP